jgi:hypothetical protein
VKKVILGANWTILRPSPAFIKNAAVSNAGLLSSIIGMALPRMRSCPWKRLDLRQLPGFRLVAELQPTNQIRSTAIDTLNYGLTPNPLKFLGTLKAAC